MGKHHLPTLDWIGKQAVANHHKDVPYRLIHCDGDRSADYRESGNLWVRPRMSEE